MFRAAANDLLYAVLQDAIDAYVLDAHTLCACLPYSFALARWDCAPLSACKD